MSALVIGLPGTGITPRSPTGVFTLCSWCSLSLQSSSPARALPLEANTTHKPKSRTQPANAFTFMSYLPKDGHFQVTHWKPTLVECHSKSDTAESRGM